MPSRKCLTLLLLFTLRLCGAPLLAQLQTGNLYGSVADESGSPLPGVVVTLAGSGVPQVQVANASGTFRFLGLAPGSYALRAELEGFSTIEYPNIVINLGRNTAVEVTLAAALEDRITVTAESPLLDERRIGSNEGVELEEPAAPQPSQPRPAAAPPAEPVAREHVPTSETPPPAPAGNDITKQLPDESRAAAPAKAGEPAKGRAAKSPMKDFSLGSPASRADRRMSYADAALRGQVENAIRNLAIGRIAWTPSLNMSQEVSEVVRLRIAGDAASDVLSGLSRKDTPLVEEIRTSYKMKAILTGDEAAFRISGISEPEQVIASPYTEWQWEVTPLKPGKYLLHLRVTATIRLPRGEVETLDVLVKNEPITVAVNRLYVLQSFLSWNWVLYGGLGGTLAAGLLGWMARKTLRKLKRRSRLPVKRWLDALVRTFRTWNPRKRIGAAVDRQQEEGKA